MAEQPIGATLDKLGVRADIADDALITGAVVILRTVRADGTERLSVAPSEGLGWVARLGMLHVAQAMQSAVIERGA